MSTITKEYNDSSIRKIRREKEEEIIYIPHKALRDESEINNKKSICEFALKDQLGEGTFGYVRLAINRQTGEKVAIKILEKKKILEYEDKIRVEREIKILKNLRHPNIIHLYSVLQTKENLYIIMEYAKGIELFEYIGKKKRIEEPTACRIFQQIINGLEYLQKNYIIHRDIKPENLIIDRKTKELKIVDFGLSNMFNTEKTRLLSSSCGSPSYAAPEMLQGKKYKPQPVDIWSSGIVLFAMVCGYLPFEDDNNDLLYRKICLGKFNIPDFVSNNCKDLLKKILVTEPYKRITIKQIKNHPWFKLYNIKGKLILYEGLFIDKYIIPIDEEIIGHISKEMGLNEKEIRLCILNNKHNDITTLYYLFLQKKVNSNLKSVADLKSDLFREYISNKDNMLNKENENFNLNNKKKRLNESSKENSKDIYNKLNYDFFSHTERNQQLSSSKKRHISYGEFNYKNTLKKSNDLNSSHNYMSQIPEKKSKFLKYKNINIENNNVLEEELEYRQKSEGKKISKKEINVFNKDKDRKNKNKPKDNNEKLEQILSSLKNEIKSKYLRKKEMKVVENQTNQLKMNNLESSYINKKSKHSYINHLISNRKKIFSTIDWDDNYQKKFNLENNNKKSNKNNNNSFKLQNREVINKNKKEKSMENKNKNNISLNLNSKKVGNNNINNENPPFTNSTSISTDKYKKKKSKNNISIIKDRKETFSYNIFKPKYKHKFSANRFNDEYINKSNSKSPVKGKSCKDINNPDIEPTLTQSINTNTYNNYYDIKSQTHFKNYLTAIIEKDKKLENSNKRKKNKSSKRQKLKQYSKKDKKKISNLNCVKNALNKNSFQKFNLSLQSPLNIMEELNNNLNLHKITSEANYFEERKITQEDNNPSNIFIPFPLSNIFITNRHVIKMEIDTILEELKLKYKNNGFSYLINSDKNDKNYMKLKIKSYYNPSINIIKYFKNGCGNLFFNNVINKIQSKIKNI